MTLPTCEEIARAAIGAPARQEGSELLWHCCNHTPDKNPSLKVNPSKNVFFCGPCNKSGNAWRFAAWIGNIDPQDKKQVVEWLKLKGLISDNGNSHHEPAAKKEKPKPVGGWELVATFHYGESLSKCRYERDVVDPSTGKQSKEKTFRWQHKANGLWEAGDGGNFKPLYVNAQFRSQEQLGVVLGFEGEAKADLAGTLGFAAFSYKQMVAEHCSILANADIVLWPDKDKPGIDQAKDARKLLIDSKEPRTLKTIAPPNELPISGDIVDAMRDFGYDKEKTQFLIDSAKTEQIAPMPVGVILAGVQAKAVSWLWNQRIPAGAITVLDGDPGLGKSLLTCEIASRISRGAPLPGATTHSVPAGVVILSAEDSISHVIVPRLTAAAADLTRIAAMPFSPEFEGQPIFSRLPNDIPVLAKAIERMDAKLIVVDVFSAYLAPGLSFNSDQDVRSALAPLAELADRTQCSVVLLRHLSKDSNRSAIYRGGGSIGIVGAARSNLLLAREPGNPDRRVLAIVKSNFGGIADALAFKIVAMEGVPVIEWAGTVNHTPESLLAAEGSPDRRRELNDATEYLQQELSTGKQEAIGLLSSARKQGISERTMRSAKAEMGVLSAKEGHRWFWRLPE